MRLVFISEHARKHKETMKDFKYDTVCSVPKTFDNIESHGNRNFDDVVAFGSSRVIDYAKLFSAKKKLTLTAIPTSISTDAIFTKETAVRKENWVYYITSKRPDKLVIDIDILLENKHRCNYAWLDILSAITAKQSALDFAIYSKKLDEANKKIIKLTNRIEKIVDMVSIFNLLYCLSKEVKICEEVGSALCVEEGIEHYMSYALENMINKRLMHGQYLAFAMEFLGVTKPLDKIGINESYTNYGLTVRDMGKAYDLGMKKLEKDVLSQYCSN